MLGMASSKTSASTCCTYLRSRRADTKIQSSEFDQEKSCERKEVYDANIRIIGVWGSGWLSLYGADAKPQLVKLAASEVLLTADFAARDLPPAIYSREAVPGLENADSVDDAGHRFRAIEALCPQCGIGACVSFEMRCPCELL